MNTIEKASITFTDKSVLNMYPEGNTAFIPDSIAWRTNCHFEALPNLSINDRLLVISDIFQLLKEEIFYAV
jgi:hypothetical protein